jgi:uncharacterized protein YjbI with pentapeptide repeats
MFFTTLVISLGISGEVPAQAPYDDLQTPEGWVWALIKEGKEANFNVRCGALDPRAKSETRWADACRRLSALFLVDVLTRAPWRQQVPYAGVNITGARIEGDIDLQSAKLDRPLFIRRSRIENQIRLDAAQTDSDVGFVGSRVAGSFAAGQLHGEQSLQLRDSEFMQAVALTGARIDGYVDMAGGTFDGELEARSLRVGTSMIMNKSRFKKVSLGDADIVSSVEMTGATFDEPLIANALHVGTSLFMRSSRFKEVNLVSARITDDVYMDGAHFDGELDAHMLQVGASLCMGARIDGELDAHAVEVEASPCSKRSTEPNKASYKRVNLRGAKVSSVVDMEGAVFDGELDADALKVEASVLMRNTTANQSINLAFARIGGNLDMRGATLAELNLSGASIAEDLLLGRFEKSDVTTSWRTAEGKPGSLDLSNSRVTNLIDTMDAWPTKGFLHLDGFTFGHLGGFDADVEMRGGAAWWDSWIRRDPKYSPTPYENLAATLVTAGDRDGADEIRFLGRVRQREEERNWLEWIFSGFLQYVAGFGIGGYTFRVLYWVIGISLAGAFYLWTCVQAAREHGPMWCFGASLARLLPLIEINKEFSDFFDDPKRARLTAWQTFVFSCIGVAGWVLGAILVAAISGLTQKP